MHAGSGSNCLEEELEQGAGKGPLRCHSDDATPAGHVGRTQSRADGSVRARGACLREEPQEGCGFRAPAASCLDCENHEAAAWRARELGVGFAPFAPCCELRGEAGLRVSAWPPCTVRKKCAKKKKVKQQSISTLTTCCNSPCLRRARLYIQKFTVQHPGCRIQRELAN